ncbi:hypothetical protein ACMD2_11785 [Ananas comosus]|uniref:Uncharacterized protein n=1 Tax=Ananas comosus TaxID=4615 RepID=A0A199UPM4_ANACO|nr:hypothetical protein ACMD2_11785 [Ananas comosus]
MAATWKVRAIARSFEKLFSNQIPRDPAPISLFPSAATRIALISTPIDSNFHFKFVGLLIRAFFQNGGREIYNAVVKPCISVPFTRRGVHASAYDKNADEHVQASVVPDDVIENGKPDKYWGPHPETGVFGPAEPNSGSTGKPASGNDPASVLEQKVWFRPHEDVDKPPHN